MDCNIVLENYRCFAANYPARIELREGIQAFVGINNVGKSTALKSLYEFRKAFAALNTAPQFHGAIQGGISPALVGPTSDLVNRDAIRSGESEAICEVELPNSRGGVAGRLAIHVTEKRVRYVLPQLAGRTIHWQLSGGWVIEGRESQGGPIIVDLADLAVACGELADTLYIPAVRAPFFGGKTGQTWYDVPLGSSLITRLDEWETNRDRAYANRFHAVKRDLQVALEIPDLEIRPVPASNRLDIRIGAATRSLDELGAGIGQFIVAAMTVAQKNPTYLLLDEPESNLHPRFQERYIRLLRKYVKRGVLFSTHSVGLARTVANRSWCVAHEPHGGSSIQPLGAPTTSIELLAELQYGSLPSLGMKQVLLVEGILDCSFMREWLRILGKDHLFLVLPLGGSAMISENGRIALDDCKRFGVPIAALIDSEKQSNASPLETLRAKFVKACQTLSIRSHVTERRALENYLSQQAVESTFGNRGFRSLGPYEDPATLCFGKENAWYAARNMTRKEILDTDVGQFVNALLD